MWNIFQVFYNYLTQYNILFDKVDKLEWAMESNGDLIDELYVLDENKELEIQGLRNKVFQLENEIVILKNKIEILESKTQDNQDEINELFDLYNSLHLN